MNTPASLATSRTNLRRRVLNTPDRHRSGRGRLRPGLRVQIAVAVWLAVMITGVVVRTTAVHAVLDSDNSVDLAARQAAVASVRADWLADSKATAAQFGHRHSVRTWDFAVWQVRLSSLKKASEEGISPGDDVYDVEDQLGEPSWTAGGTRPEPYGYVSLWKQSSAAATNDYLYGSDSYGSETSVVALLPRGDGTALLVAEQYQGADWTAFDKLQENLDRHVRVLSVLSALGAWLLSGLLMRPARRAAAVARRLGRGALDARVPVTGRDEVGSLGLALNEMADDLQRMIAAQRHFISDTAHELRTPTAALLASAAALEEPSTRDEAAVMVAPQLRRLSSLTEDLLSLSRFDDDRERRDDQVVDLVDLARSAAAQVAGSADIRVDADGPVFAIVDPARVSTVVRNLVANGLRHGEAPVRVVVSERGDQAVVRVDDAGRGVPEELRGRIFDRFVRGDDARHGEGAGLGLAIARENAQLHGGSLAVSPDGHGFLLTLPTTPPAPNDLAPHAVRAGGEVVGHPRPTWGAVVDDVVTGLFCNGVVFMALTPVLFGLHVLNDYGRFGLAVGLVLVEVLTVALARQAARAGVLGSRRWLLSPAALLVAMLLAGLQYRLAVAASMALAWALWMLLSAWGRRLDARVAGGHGDRG